MAYVLIQRLYFSPMVYQGRVTYIALFVKHLAVLIAYHTVDRQHDVTNLVKLGLCLPRIEDGADMAL
jgi:hypothetical protein